MQCAGMLHFYVEINVCVFDALQVSRPCSSLQRLRQDGSPSCPGLVPVVTMLHISHPIETKKFFFGDGLHKLKLFQRGVRRLEMDVDFSLE